MTSDPNRSTLQRWFRAAWTAPALFSLALLLSACTQREWERLMEAFIMMLAVALLAMIVITCISLVYSAICLIVTIYNFARPNRLTMVTAWILGGINGLTALGGVVTSIAMAFETEIPTPIESVLGGVFSSLIGVAFAALMIWSGFKAHATLSGMDPLDDDAI